MVAATKAQAGFVRIHTQIIVPARPTAPLIVAWLIPRENKEALSDFETSEGLLNNVQAG